MEYKWYERKKPKYSIMEIAIQATLFPSSFAAKSFLIYRDFQELWLSNFSGGKMRNTVKLISTNESLSNSLFCPSNHTLLFLLFRFLIFTKQKRHAKRESLPVCTAFSTCLLSLCLPFIQHFCYSSFSSSWSFFSNHFPAASLRFQNIRTPPAAARTMMPISIP